MNYEKKINKGQDSYSIDISLVNGKYQLHYLVLGRKNTTADEKRQGIKKKRFKKDEVYIYIDEINEDSLSVIPSIELKDSMDSPEKIISIIHEEGI
ncbi:TPA: hypothetical protein MG739_25070 [Klebsiella pneumoniae]|uniref:Uncharacterized protein n=1 Tax=Klebsiella pneumoniae TaxID=573 RepID=A0A3G4RJ96_KLEPN|nr:MULTISPECIES: hypothetical protein [Klebsiella]AYU65728.1 hypothetical protein [Klebsiella pneumoniae]MBC4425498.1 hypothetical protein [Klebsiella variicola]MBK2797272.1 hypothetical protein [Klebsiella pneumoniae]OUY91582.1 hypothetical protein BLL04_19695 [Klebsiella variicola]QIM13738.1 hypothetical protein [Klebsiella pneumoniae]